MLAAANQSGRIIFTKMVQGKENIAVRHEKIDESAVGQRIDNYLLRTAKGVPKSHLYRILRSGSVRVNGHRVRQTYRLALGDEVRIPPLRMSEPAAQPAFVPAGEPLPVVFEDDYLIVINKPAGRAVHGGSGISFGVIEQLRAQRPELKTLELAHRLDRDTSGLLIVAKRRTTLAALHDMMRAGTVEKHYLGLVAGRWPNPLQHVRTPLFKYLTETGERRVKVSEEGKPAHSIVRLCKRWQQYSLLDIELKTGRTHQIRVHLAHLGFPLAGDDKYGNFALNGSLAGKGLRRMFLHAAKLTFTHPENGQTLVFEAPLPGTLQHFINWLDEQEP
ncbi:MAG: RluA family pseudouridine synthase [Azoarcus sp.]|jgi:23S rRNA pseudouridine955/2504/2580 synthase|nr:RluA family pseudouridine synthase [Azoarcus sp.]